MKYILLLLLSLFTTSIYAQFGHIDIEGAIKLSDENTSTPIEGMIRWNTSKKDFEGYNGAAWVSLTMPEPLDPMYNTFQIYNDDFETSDPRMGTSVEIQGDFAFIGVPKEITSYETSPNAYVDKAGAVHVYKFNGYTWDFHSKLVPKVDQNEGFGIRIAAHQNTLAISAVRVRNTGLPITPANFTNSIYIYEYEQNRWIQKHEILDPDNQISNGFGLSLSIFGSTMVVGSPYKSINGSTGAGSAFVYKYSEEDEVWEQYGPALLPNQPRQDDNFGISVVVFKELVVIGAPSRDIANNINQGQIFYYTHNSSQYTLLQTVNQPNAEALDNFGYSLAISGNILVAGSIGRTINGTVVAGSVSTFKRNNSGLWVFVEEINCTNPESLDFFGFSVDIYNDMLVVGAFGREPSGNSNFGSAVIFKNNGKNWIQQDEKYDPEFIADAYTGYSVAIGKYHIIVGSPRAYAQSDFQRPGKAFIAKHGL